MQTKCELLQEKKETLLNSIKDAQEQFEFLQNQATQSAQTVYESSLALAQEKFAIAAENERLKYLETIEQYKQELETIMQDGAAAYGENIAEWQEKCKELANKYAILLATTNAAIAAAIVMWQMKQ